MSDCQACQRNPFFVSSEWFQLSLYDRSSNSLDICSRKLQEHLILKAVLKFSQFKNEHNCLQWNINLSPSLLELSCYCIFLESICGFYMSLLKRKI